jgi:hypothetical protein
MMVKHCSRSSPHSHGIMTATMGTKILWAFDAGIRRRENEWPHGRFSDAVQPVAVHSFASPLVEFHP